MFKTMNPSDEFGTHSETYIQCKSFYLSIPRMHFFFFFFFFFFGGKGGGRVVLTISCR